MPYDEPADLIGSCEATLDTLAAAELRRRR